LLTRCRSNLAPLTPWESDFLDEVAGWRRPPSPKQIAILERIANRISSPELAARLADRVETIATSLKGSPPTFAKGKEVRYGARFSLSVVVSGNEKGQWYDHEAGIGGDALGLIQHLRGRGPADAVEWAKGFLGIEGADLASLPPAPPPPPPKPIVPKATLPLARAIWGEATTAAGTVVEAYLCSRGLTLPLRAPLRFHPACPRDKERLPAMVALMTNAATGEPCGVHRTFLRLDGSGKAEGQAKMMLGGVGVIRLVPDEDVTTGLGLAEGIETALSVMQGAGWSPVWAAGNAGAIGTFPVLPGIEALTIFADGDEAADKAANSCVERWTREGREVTIHRPPAGADWNDIAARAA
jgi:hypothetical protein